MTSDGPGPGAPGAPGAPHPDAAHLDEDPEALEDPVHSGDAKHQQELHQHEPRRDRQRPAPEPGDDLG